MRQRRAGLANGSVLAWGVACLALTWPVRAATVAPSHEAVSVEIDGERLLLPAELRRLVAPASPSVFGPERTVLIGWRVRERSSFQGYRITAVLEGGPLSGAVVRWNVDTLEGRAEPDGRRTYGVRLPVEISPGMRVRAAIEAVLDDGRGVLLATRVAWPAVQPATGQAWYPRQPSHPRIVRLVGVAPVFPPRRPDLAQDGPSCPATPVRHLWLSRCRSTGHLPRGPPVELSSAPTV